ncbi:uncharacterized protein [Aquarana catesbeiana]|uniref:uncharacterized protein n=1 Tax=Aquarana catesbeiana TaxID=8400 RepID=UPI003CCA09F6
MRPFTVGALFILLGIILLQVAFSDKEGKCKYSETFAPCRILQRGCQGDGSCRGREKCCQAECTMECVGPEYKEAKCKYYDTFAPCRILQRGFQEDPSCPGKEKCCQVECAMKCVGPNFKPGSCPNRPSVCPTNIQNGCNTDQDCSGNRKCYHICGYRCTEPVPDEKRGQCPHFRNPNPYAFFPCRKLNTTACKTDEHCGGQQKCCKEYCVHKCRDPVEPTYPFIP